MKQDKFPEDRKRNMIALDYKTQRNYRPNRTPVIYKNGGLR